MLFSENLLCGEYSEPRNLLFACLAHACGLFNRARLCIALNLGSACLGLFKERGLFSTPGGTCALYDIFGLLLCPADKLSRLPPCLGKLFGGRFSIFNTFLDNTLPLLYHLHYRLVEEPP